MTATLDTKTLRGQLESLTVAQLLSHAKDQYGMVLGKKLPKAALVTALVEREEKDRAEEAARGDVDPSEYGTVPLEDQTPSALDQIPVNMVYDSLPEVPEAPEKLDLAEFKDHPENKVTETLPGFGLTREQIQARINAARMETEEAARERKAAEASKPHRYGDVSLDEITRRYGKIGYAIGVLVQATSRLKTETKKADNIAVGLGEAMDREAWDLCKDRMVEGFAKAWDTYKFPSKALRGMDGEEMVQGIWAEMMAAMPGLAIFTQFEEEGGED